MSWAHKGSNLALKDMLIAVPDDAHYFPFDHHLASTKLLYPEGWDNHTVTDYGLYTGTNLCATLRKGEGKYGNAVAIEESTVNRFSFPSFNTSSSYGGWSHWGSTGHQGTYGQTTDRKYIYGDQQYAHWVANGSSASANYLLYKSPSLEGTPSYRSLSCIVCMEDFSEVTQDKIFPSWNAATTNGVPRGSWTSIERIPGTNFYICKAEGFHQDGTNDLVGVYIRPGYKAYFSIMQLEDKKFATSFVNGSRDSGYLAYNTQLNLSEGSVALWFRSNNEIIPDGYHVGIWGQDAPRMGVFLANNTGKFAFRLDDSWSDGGCSSTHQARQDIWTFVVATWDLSTTRLFTFQDNEVSIQESERMEDIPAQESNSIKIGCSYTGVTNRANGLVDDLLIMNRALSPEEIRSIYHSQRPLYDPNRIDHIVG